MKALAIITARGGSKRIPRKNIKEFLGKPIMTYSIEAAIGAGVFDEVMVSTEDEEIASIAKEYGAHVPFYRSEKTAGDYATTDDVINEVLDRYEAMGQHYDIVVCIYPTAPFITSERLKAAVEMLENSKADAVQPVVSFSYPPQRALVIKDERLVFNEPQYLNSRSQDLEKHYHDVGQFYVLRVESYRRVGGLMRGDILPLELSELEVQDIDNEVDWQLAELKYKLIHNIK